MIQAGQVLSKREKQVVNLIAVECKTNKEAARELGISPRSIEDYRYKAMVKLDCKNLAQLVRYVALREAANAQPS